MLRSNNMNQKGFVPFKIIILTLLIVVIAIGGLYLIREFKNNTRKNYVEGEVVVSFKDGVTYGEAEDYMNSIGLTLNNPDDFNNVPNTDRATRLDIHDIYTIKVAKGKEDYTVNLIMQKDIIHAAMKNWIAHVN